MYIPASFAETNLTVLHDFIKQHSFGQLVSQVDGAPFVTHLPFLLDTTVAELGCLVGHMARANPQWNQFSHQTALAVFSGPHAYISPTWYEAEHVVPTWNYIAVHAFGRVEVIEDRAELLEIVRKSASVYERSMPRPWSFDAKATFIEKLLAQIVGFRLVIDRLEGKWKLNQNQPAERREKVIRALTERGGDDALAMAAAIRQTLGSD